jgi:hypothetical protein
MVKLAKDKLAIWVTLLALLSQMFLGIIHSTAVWVAAAGPVGAVEADSVSARFFQICSAGGLVVIEGKGQSHEDRRDGYCPVCVSAATATMMEGSVPVFLDAPLLHALFPVALVDQMVARNSEQSVFIRGPPLSIQFS